MCYWRRRGLNPRAVDRKPRLGPFPPPQGSLQPRSRHPARWRLSSYPRRAVQALRDGLLPILMKSMATSILRMKMAPRKIAAKYRRWLSAYSPLLFGGLANSLFFLGRPRGALGNNSWMRFLATWCCGNAATADFSARVTEPVG
jgi:hypothetical protein